MKWIRTGVFVCRLFIPAALLLAQTNTPTDTTAERQEAQPHKKRGGNGNGASEELILDDIQIIGKVEKPGVIILPKRVEPELGEIELERSFDQEMKEGMDELPQLNEELGKVDRVQSIKKAVEKERK